MTSTAFPLVVIYCTCMCIRTDSVRLCLCAYMCDMHGTCTEFLACAYGAVHSTLNSETYVLPISDVCISRFIILYTIVGSHRVYMYVVSSLRSVG